MRRRRAADDTLRLVSSRFQHADDAAELAEAGRGRLGADVRIAVRDAAVDHRARDAAALDAAAGGSVDHRFFDPDVFDRALDQTEQTEPVASVLHVGRRAAGNKHAGDRVAVAVKRAGVAKAHVGAAIVPVGDRLPDAKTGRFCRPGLPVRRVVERNVGGQLCPGAAVFRGAVGQIAVDERGEPRKLLRRSDLVGRGLRAVGRLLHVVAPVAPAAGDRGRLAGELFAGLVANVKRRGLHVFSRGDGRKFQRRRRVAHADARERDRVLLVAAGERIVGAEISRCRRAVRRRAQRQLDGCVLTVLRKIAKDLARVIKAVDACNIQRIDSKACSIWRSAFIRNLDRIRTLDKIVLLLCKFDGQLIRSFIYACSRYRKLLLFAAVYADRRRKVFLCGCRAFWHHSCKGAVRRCQISDRKRADRELSCPDSAVFKLNRVCIDLFAAANGLNRHSQIDRSAVHGDGRRRYARFLAGGRSDGDRKVCDSKRRVAQRAVKDAGERAVLRRYAGERQPVGLVLINAGLLVFEDGIAAVELRFAVVRGKRPAERGSQRFEGVRAHGGCKAVFIGDACAAGQAVLRQIVVAAAIRTAA